MSEFKESYPKMPESNQMGIALTKVLEFSAAVRDAVKRIDSRVAKLEMQAIDKMGVKDE